MIAVILGLPFALWAAFRLTLPTANFEFDWDATHGTFFILYMHLVKTAWAIFWVGLFGGFGAAYVFGATSASALLLASSIYAVLFNVWLLRAYEAYLHGRYPHGGGAGASNYTPSKYAATLALAAATILCFIGGLCAAMDRIGHAQVIFVAR